MDKSGSKYNGLIDTEIKGLFLVAMNNSKMEQKSQCVI